MTIGWVGRELWGGFADLLFPPQCVWCQVPTQRHQRLCPACRKRFVSNYYRCCKCASPLPTVLPNTDCVRCRAGKWRFSSVITLAPYRGQMRQAVIMMKRKRFEPLRRAVAELLAEKLLHEFSAGMQIPSHQLQTTPLAADPIAADPVAMAAGLAPASSSHLPILVPVPYHWTHGFSTAADTASVLARGIAAYTHWPLVTGAVRRHRKTAKQGILSWSERTRNVRRAFAMRAPQLVQGRQVLLVDDVLTSGATAAELTRLLLSAGALQVTVVVAARGTGVRESRSVE